MKHKRIDPENILYFSVGTILALVFSSGILYYIFGINLLDYLPGFSVCPFHALTGKHCPGCGMSRAFLLLGQLKIRDALELNLFSVPLLLLMIIYFAFRRVPMWMQNKYLVRVTLVTVLMFWITRLFKI